MSSQIYCKLDRFDCLSLYDVVTSFCAPIKEEHAWAILHQGMLALLSVSGQSCYLVRGMQDVMLHKEGFVHANTFTNNLFNDKIAMTSLATGVAELGVVVYDALEFSVVKDSSMERKLSPELENVLDVVTSADEVDAESLDEGFGEEDVSKICDEVLKLCRHHLALPGEATKHFQDVCRAVVAEALELASIMMRLSCQEDIEELENLDQNDWAGIFNNVMSELRKGVKLRSVEYTRTPSEFCLTPYEMLMDEVKFKKVSLKSPKVSASASVQKAARDQILEFIKNRPPLKSVNERKLNARKTEETPAENLMNEIRGGRARQSLRRTKRRKSQSMAEGFGKVLDKPATCDKQIINLDLSFASTICNFDDESPVSSPEPCLDNLYDNDHLFDQESKNETFSSITPMPSRFDSSTPMPSSSKERPEQDLTLEEVSHIRTQITRGELEQLDLPVEKKMDYDKGLICFMCATTRFGVFHWAYPCHLCKRQVCKKCCEKIKLPSHKLSEITVSSLKSRLNKGDEESSLPIEKSWQRSASFSYNNNTRKNNSAVNLRRQTLTKGEVERRNVGEASFSPGVAGVNSTVCIDCKDLLASLVWGKNGKSPKKRSIFDIQSMTISKRKPFK